MVVTKIFSEGSYFYWCNVSEVQPGLFSCSIAFAIHPNSKSFKMGDLRLNGAFASADTAMGVGERYGRSMIREHGDVAQYLATHALLVE